MPRQSTLSNRLLGKVFRQNLDLAPLGDSHPDRVGVAERPGDEVRVEYVPILAEWQIPAGN